MKRAAIIAKSGDGLQTILHQAALAWTKRVLRGQEWPQQMLCHAFHGSDIFRQEIAQGIPLFVDWFLKNNG